MVNNSSVCEFVLIKFFVGGYTMLPQCLTKVVYLVDYCNGRFLHEAAQRLTINEYEEIVQWAIKTSEPLAFEPTTRENFIANLLKKYKNELIDMKKEEG
jgi:hypothetical protein